LPNLGGKPKIIQDYGLRIGVVDLKSNTHIAVGEIAAVFGETSAVWDHNDVDEFDHIAAQQNTIENTQQFTFYVSGSTPGNQGRFHIIPKEDAELALSMKINPSLRHSLHDRSIWKGEGQHAKHTCCRRHQNVELQFTTAQIKIVSFSEWLANRKCCAQRKARALCKHIRGAQRKTDRAYTQRTKKGADYMQKINK